MELPEGAEIRPSVPTKSASASSPSPTSTKPGAARPRAPILPRLGPLLFAAIGVGIVVAFFALGAFSPGGSAGLSGGSSYAQAEAEANRSAGTVAGGPWNLVAALGYAPAASQQTSTSSAVGSGCKATPAGVGPIPTSVTIPGFSGSFSSGDATWWGMFYRASSGSEFLIVEVLEGTATPLAVASGACVSEFANLTAVPSNVVDSPVAASAAWTEGGSAFRSVHSGLALNLEMALVGGGTYSGSPLGPTWFVDYSPCLPLGLGGPSGDQPELAAVVNAESGSAVTAATSTTC